jgi:hypothetical protein
MACAERVLLPAVRAAQPGDLVVADGFSCRTQVEQGGTGRQAVHLAEVLAAAVRGDHPGEHPEATLATRPAEPSTVARATALAATAAGLAAATRATLRRLRR